MLDYYSDYAMPDLYSRIKDAEDVIIKPNYISRHTYEKIIENVCKDTPEYSWTGWIFYGRKDAHNKIIARIEGCENNIKLLCDAIYKNIITKRTYYKWIQIACRPPKFFHEYDIGGTLYHFDTRIFNNHNDIKYEIANSKVIKEIELLEI